MAPYAPPAGEASCSPVETGGPPSARRLIHAPQSWQTERMVGFADPQSQHSMVGPDRSSAPATRPGRRCAGVKSALGEPMRLEVELMKGRWPEVVLTKESHSPQKVDSASIGAPHAWQVEVSFTRAV